MLVKYRIIWYNKLIYYILGAYSVFKNRIFSTLISLIIIFALMILGNIVPLCSALSLLVLFFGSLLLTFKQNKNQGLVITALTALFALLILKQE